MKKQKKTEWQWARHQKRWFGKWHLYVGIIAGAIVAFTGLTGSILAFRDEIDSALNTEMFHVPQQQQHRMTLGEIVPVVKKNYPGLQFSYLMSQDVDNPHLAYRFFNFKTEEEFFINPYTGKLSGKRIYESAFIHVVTDLHRSMLVPVVGRYIVGLASLCLLILTISGLRLWIPAKWKQLKSVLTVKFSSGFKRQNYDWHNVLGFYSAPVVSLLALTGFCITFSPLIIALLFVMDGKSPQGVSSLLGAKSVYTAGAKAMTVSEAMATAKTVMPDTKVWGISLPNDSTGNYRFDLIGPGLPKSGKREMLILDQYSGKVLLNSRIHFPNSGNAYLSWMTPVHYGSFGGVPTKILALLGGLMPLALFVTGFIIWWPRYRKQRKQKQHDRKAVLSKTETERRSEVNAVTPSLSAWQYFAVNFKKGLKYAAYMALIAALMGALYGLIAGIIIQPAVFAIAFTTLVVIMNFVVALLVYLIRTVFLLPFKKGGRGVVRYFALSLSFLLVFVSCYLLLLNTGMQVF